ncbi:TetR/AcrR family transcriptional regulator [Pseudochelatococcus sp. B33]
MVALRKSKIGRGSREQILEAALNQFASKGIDGARVDDIARLANVNKNLIYHYFQSKEKLFIAVLEHVYETVREHQQDLRLRNLGPEEAMHELVHFTADVWIEIPEFIRLLASENLHEARHVLQSPKILEMYNPLVETLTSILESGVEQGIFREGIDPIDLYISITSLSAHYVAHRYTFEAIFKRNLMTPSRLRKRKEVISEMILCYLKNK